MKSQLNDQNQLTSFLFSSENMKTLYQKYSDVILVDSTYKTNKYKMPLLIFAAINNQNKTFLIGFSVIKDETYESVNWVFKHLFEYLEIKPTIIVSDSCKTLKKNISEVLAESTHLICGWHVSQNIKSHLTALSKFLFVFIKLFKGSHLTPKEIEDVINIPNISSKKQVEEIFEKILSLKIPEKSKSYYDEKFETKEAWCMAYKKSLPCLRIGTTSRIEGINAIVKTELNLSSRLVELLLRMLQINDHILNKSYSDGNLVSDLLLENLKDNSLLISIKDLVSEYVYKQVALSISKSFDLIPKLYKGVYTITTKDGFNIEIDKKNPNCTCKYYTTMGIICSHLVAVVLKNKDFLVQRFIRKRWIKDPFEKDLSDMKIIAGIKDFLMQEEKNNQEFESKNSEVEEDRISEGQIKEEIKENESKENQISDSGN